MKTNQKGDLAAVLQQVLTRYIDSIEGLRLACDYSSDRALVRLCCDAVEMRRIDADEIAFLIGQSGAEASLAGSAEAAIHRGWIRLLCSALPSQRVRLLTECLRGEKELISGLRTVVRDHVLPDRHLMAINDMTFDVGVMIERLNHLREAARESRVHLLQPETT